MLTADAEKTEPGGKSSEAVVELLSNPSSYSERPKHVQQIETHISWVFLTERYAYKLKKPVKFDFLDFSSVELRQFACQEELRLNRRLASDVYLGVVPITLNSNGRLQLNGAGKPIDWVVKMRRLPAEQSLDQLILAGRVSQRDAMQVATKLSGFYQQLPPLTIQVDKYRQQILSHVADNHRELSAREHHFSLPLVNRLDHAQLRLLRLAPDVLDNRVRDGRIVDGHGDLRPEHIYLNGHPTIIDCLEFSAELRTLDVLDELAFLAMECDRLGAESIGRDLMRHYQRNSGDSASGELLDFYKMYRVCVRAKVLSLRAIQLGAAEEQQALESAAKYLQLGEKYSRTMGRPLLLVVRGLPASGKSTLASAVAESLNLEVLQTDAIRRELFGHSSTSTGFAEQQYRPESRTLVYDEMFARAAKLLGEKQSVILDGTFLSASLRQRAAQLAQDRDATLLFVECVCPEPVAVERINERLAAGDSLSETRPEFYRAQQQLNEPDPPDLPVCRVDTTSSLPALLQEIHSRLRPILLPSLRGVRE